MGGDDPHTDSWKSLGVGHSGRGQIGDTHTLVEVFRGGRLRVGGMTHTDLLKSLRGRNLVVIGEVVGGGGGL